MKKIKPVFKFISKIILLSLLGLFGYQQVKQEKLKD